MAQPIKSNSFCSAALWRDFGMIGTKVHQKNLIKLN
jgi:hypothetical protein